MSIRVKWANDKKTIIYSNVVNGWGWPDLENARFKACDMIDTVDHQVDIVVDIRNNNKLPDNPMGNFKRITANRHPKLGMVVIVGATAYLRAIFNGFCMIYGDQVKSTHLVATWEEAYALLNHHQAETPLPPMQASLNLVGPYSTV